MTSRRCNGIVTTQIGLLFLIASFVLTAGKAVGQETAGTFHVAAPEDSLGTRRAAVDPALVPRVLRLPPAERAAAAELEALRSQGSRVTVPGVPYRIGFARSGPERRVDLPAGALWWSNVRVGELRSSSPFTVSWLGRVVVEDARALRILLADLTLPEHARIWVDARGRRFGPYGSELLDSEGNLWLPPVPGPEAVVEIEVPLAGAGPASPLRFTLGRVMELVTDPVSGNLEPKAWTDCDVDASCIDPATLPTIDQLRQATARLIFVKGEYTFVCTGGLLNDTDPSTTRPFLLTANHCFDTQTVASSLVAYFDYFTDGCNGTAPGLGDVPSVAGATLLETSPNSDFTLVELSANPSGFSWYLGWVTTRPTDGKTLHRVSHPQATPQKYSESFYPGSVLCAEAPTDRFLYTEPTLGVTAGGSSGAPLTQAVDGDARVVGQLLGSCGPVGFDECDYASYNDVDGAFDVTYPLISQWLDPPPACNDLYEPDGTSANASSIYTGVDQRHSLCPAGDEDWVRFVLGDESGVEIETSGPDGDTELTLYDGSLSVVELDDDGGTKVFSRIDRLCGVDALPAGTYFAKVNEYGGDHEIADYTLTYTRIESCSGSCPNELTLSGTTLTGTQSRRAHVSITLGPSLTANGTSIDVLAGQRVVFESGTAIGGSFSAGTDPEACGL